jgi:hypothetical protein
MLSKSDFVKRKMATSTDRRDHGPADDLLLHDRMDGDMP